MKFAENAILALGVFCLILEDAGQQPAVCFCQQQSRQLRPCKFGSQAGFFDVREEDAVTREIGKEFRPATVDEIEGKRHRVRCSASSAAAADGSAACCGMSAILHSGEAGCQAKAQSHCCSRSQHHIKQPSVSHLLIWSSCCTACGGDAHEEGCGSPQARGGAQRASRRREGHRHE